MSDFKPGDVVFVTKWALTDGITKTTVGSVHGRYVYAKWIGGMNGVAQFVPGEYHATEAEARDRASDMIGAKKVSLMKQMAKMERMLVDGVKLKQMGSK